MRKKLPLTNILIIVVLVLLTTISSVLSGIVSSLIPPSLIKYLQYAWLALGIVTLALIGLTVWQFLRQTGTEPSAVDTSKDREIMLGQVQNHWITGLLENPLYYSYDAQLLPLPLRERIGSRFDLVLSNPPQPTQIMPSGTTITQVFDLAGGELFILGESGAGKTTKLLELARDLLKRAQDNPKALIPVVLMLSSWATKKLSLEQWITEELKAKYDIPSQIGKKWVKDNQLLLLLDGLDEVAPSALPACIDAINEYYYQAHRSLVVCSRMKEFLDQSGRLALHAAVTVQPLSSPQVDSYLDDLMAKGEEIEGLKRALHQSAKLSALATTPLFLIVLIMAYHGKPMQEILAFEIAEATDQQHLIFHDYVERILLREGAHIRVPAQQTKHWLAWLACQMTAHHQSEFYLEQFQPDWLPERQRALYKWSSGLSIGLLFGLPVGFSIWLSIKLSSQLSIGLLGWLSVVLFILLCIAWIGWLFRRITHASVLTLATPPRYISPFGKIQFGLDILFRWLVLALFAGLGSGLIVEEFLRLSKGHSVGLSSELFGWLLFGLSVGLLFGLSVGLYSGLAEGALQPHFFSRRRG